MNLPWTNLEVVKCISSKWEDKSTEKKRQSKFNFNDAVSKAIANDTSNAETISNSVLMSHPQASIISKYENVTLRDVASNQDEKTLLDFHSLVMNDLLGPVGMYFSPNLYSLTDTVHNLHNGNRIEAFMALAVLLVKIHMAKQKGTFKGFINEHELTPLGKNFIKS